MGLFLKNRNQLSGISLCVLNKTIILLALVGYVIVIAKEARSAELAIYNLISNVRPWNNC